MKRIAVIWIAIASSMPGTLVSAAETYPTRPVRMIVPYAPGGNGDIQARYTAERLGDVFGKQFVVDNRPGANGMIGAEMAARSPADGYTLLFIANTFTASPGLFPKVPYDTVKDFQAISLVGDTPLLFAANPSVAAGSVKELIALAKSRPGQLNYGTTGSGSPSHLAAELFGLMAGVKLVHVPYKGMAASNIGVMTGEIQLGFPSVTSALTHVKAGKLKALAITVKSRSALAPGIPTMAEAGVPGYEASIWNGVVAPARTPRLIVDRLHDAIVQILKSPQAQERYANVGADIRYNSPEEFQALIRSDMVKWAKVIKAAGVRVDQP